MHNTLNPLLNIYFINLMFCGRRRIKLELLLTRLILKWSKKWQNVWKDSNATIIGNQADGGGEGGKSCCLFFHDRGKVVIVRDLCYFVLLV